MTRAGGDGSARAGTECSDGTHPPNSGAVGGASGFSPAKQLRELDESDCERHFYGA